jgi:hypothetical protein
MSFIPLCENLFAEKYQQSYEQQQYIQDDRYQDCESNLGKDFMPLRMVDDDADDVDEHGADEAAQSYQQLGFHPLA